MKKIIMYSIVSGIIFSCNPPAPENAVVKAPVDDLITNWSNSWNKHDSIAVGNLFATDPLLIDDGLIAADNASIAAKWIHPNIKVVNNLKTVKIQDWSTNDRAGYTGKYELDVVVNDSVIAKPKGMFTVNWIKTEKGDWKITTAHIHSLPEKK